MNNTKISVHVILTFC